MSRRLCVALGLAASVVCSQQAFGFDFEGFRSGMSRQDILGRVGAEPMQSVSGPNGSTIELSKPYSFELCDGRLVGVSKIIDRSVWLEAYTAYTARFGDSAIQAKSGQYMKSVYFLWPDGEDKIILGLNIDTKSVDSSDLGYAINIRGRNPCLDRN